MTPFTCNMEALKPEERLLHISLAKDLFSTVQDIRTLEDGFAFLLRNTSNAVTRLADFISNEQLCCPFFGFAIILEPEGAGLWLHITGGNSIKQFIQAEIGRALPGELAKKLDSMINSNEER